MSQKPEDSAGEISTPVSSSQPTLAATASEAEAITDKSKVDFTKGGPDNFKFYPDNPTNHKHKYNWVMKEPTKFYDPCEQSRQASMNCMLRTEDKSDCEDFFQAYRDCKRDFFENKRKEKREGKGGWGLW